MEQEKREAGTETESNRGKILLATVKGDVHDIGKNIVGVVLGCNNYEVIDLGVMVPAEKILETAIRQSVDVIGLSGLITPSLDQMVHVASEMQRQGFSIPLLIGGATTSAKHTAVKIAPAYEHATVHVLDASRCVGVAERLLNPNSQAAFLQENQRLQSELVASYRQRQVKLAPYEQAREHPFTTDWSSIPIDTPAFLGRRTVNDLDLAQLRPLIDWSPFFHAWEMKGKYPAILEDATYGEEARRLLQDAQQMLDQILRDRSIAAQGVYGFWPAAAEGDDVVLFTDDARERELTRFHFLRQQWERPGQSCFRCLADYVAPRGSGREDYLGAFVVTAGQGADALAQRYEAEHDDYRAILVKALADRLAEAFAEFLHQQARIEWGYGQKEGLSNEQLIAEEYRGIRPAPGYPACPDHTEKQALFELLQAETEAGVTLTESYAMIPAASVSGFYFAHPQARYFSVDRIARDQVEDYARRTGRSVAETERWLSPNLGYDPG